MGFRHPVVVDIEGYRHRRRQKVEDIARRAAEKAARQRTPVRLRPMTPYERRIVHVALRNDSRVVTASEGTEPYRQVVIKPRSVPAYRSLAERAATRPFLVARRLYRQEVTDRGILTSSRETERQAVPP